MKYGLSGALVVGLALIFWPLALSVAAFGFFVVVGTNGLNNKASPLVLIISAGMAVAMLAALISTVGFVPDRR